VKSIWFAAIGVLAVMLAGFAGCEYLPFMAAKPPPKVEATPTPTPTSTPTPTATATPEVKKRKHHRRLHTPTPEAAPTPMSEASPATTVITTGESAGRTKEIEQSLVLVEQRLSTIKRSTLDSQGAADYDRVKAFIAAARSALHEQDDLRAHSLEEKASRLAAQLAGRAPSP
jgi:hypothetical protein